MWGNEPWDNDAAADWFGKLLDKTDLPKHVRKTLLLSKEDDPYGENTAELRAAAYCVLQLGRVYIWPIASLKEDLQIAINALEMVLSNEDYCYSTEIKDQIGAEKRELTSRLDRLKQASG
ncbi:MAG: hypothetical protein HKN25_18120 [Pyrinomonadaceae bacterium]|nr:hypothetical protein [Pyrinomonadaceae bacterium]